MLITKQRYSLHALIHHLYQIKRLRDCSQYNTQPSCLVTMGSLMAGWDSPVLGDDKKVHARRNWSLTKEEVEAFWKQRRRSSEDGGDLASPLASPAARESPFGSLEKAARSPARGGTNNKPRGAASPRVRVDGFLPAGDDDGAAADSPSKSRDWWTRSNWAFLNEPPQEEPASSRAQNYTPQFHVAQIATGNVA